MSKEVDLNYYKNFIQEMRDRWFCGFEYLKHDELKDFSEALAYLDELIMVIEKEISACCAMCPKCNHEILAMCPICEKVPND